MKIKLFSFSIVILITVSFFSNNLFAKKKFSSKVVKEEMESYNKVEQQIKHYKKLVKRKKDMERLFEKNDLKQIEALFNLDSKEIERSIENKDLNKLDSLYFDLSVVYKKIPLLKYRLKYDLGRISFLKKKYDIAKKSFETIYKENKDFDFLDDVIYNLQYLYLIFDKNEEVIKIFNDYNGVVKSDQIYWMAQANYNLNNYSKAKELFEKSIKYPKYKLKSKEMLALIESFDNGIEAGISKFLSIEEYKKKDIDKADLNFIYISLARLYFAKDDYANSEKYYEDYLNSSNDKSSGMMMELGQLYFKKGDYENARKYFAIVTENPESNQYYVSAKYMLAIIQAQGNDIIFATKDIKEEINKINNLIDKLNLKYSLMNEIDDANKLIVAAKDSISIIAANNLIKSKEKELKKLNKDILELSKTINPKYAKLLLPIEDEYLGYSRIIASFDANIEKLATTKPIKIPKKIDNEIALLDSEFIQLHALELLSNLKDAQWKDYQLAFAISSEIKWQKDMLSTWEKIREKSIKEDREDIKEKADKSIDLLKLNLVSLSTISKFYFNDNTDPALKKQIEEEAQNILASKKKLKEIKELVLNNYHKVLIKKIENKKTKYSQDQLDLLNTYNKLINKILAESKDQKGRFQSRLFDLLYERINNLSESSIKTSKTVN